MTFDTNTLTHGIILLPCRTNGVTCHTRNL